MMYLKPTNKKGRFLKTFASGGGPTILLDYLQRYETSLNPFRYSVVCFFYVIKHPTKKAAS
jgi:hypothetical protein